MSIRTQSVLVNDVQSAPSILKYGVPQGSVLGPILFIMYTQTLGCVIQQLGTTYAFSPLFFFFFLLMVRSYMTAFSCTFRVSSLIRDMTSSIEELGVWVKENKLKTNDDKTELISIRSKSKLKQVNTSSMVFHDCETVFSESVRNVRKFLDESLSKEIHVNQLCKVLYFHVANTLASFYPVLILVRGRLWITDALCTDRPVGRF